MEVSALEKALKLEGYRFIAGCDEAGRGALAGPVVAGAVVLSYDRLPSSLMDSKRLTRKKRELIAAEIKEMAVGYATYVVEPREVERINVLQASLKAMVGAAGKLGLTIDCLLVDGNHAPKVKGLHVQSIVGGDDKIACIAAASILAKVDRDFIMEQHARKFPRYHFDSNKGYPTQQHLEAIRRYGPCKLHRRTFKPVRETLNPTLFST